MGIDSVRAALQIVTGAGELTRTKALEAAGNLLALPGVGPTAARATQAAGQVSNLADELVAAAAANREMVRSLVTQEIENQMQRVGVATTSDVAALREEIDRLQVEVATLRAEIPADAPAAASASTARKTPAKKTAARTTKQAAARKTPAKKTTKKAPTKSTRSTSTATKSTARKSTRHG